MELEQTTRLKRTAALKSPTFKADPVPAEKSSPLQKASRADRLTLSQQALTYLEEQNEKMQEQLRQEAERQSGSDSDKAALDLLEKSMKAMKKCEQIAARIIAGDKVPPEDERYLMENDVDGYRMAIAMRKPKKDPKEWESVLDDEDKNAGSSEESVSAEGPAPSESSAGAESSSGGEL